MSKYTVKENIQAADMKRSYQTIAESIGADKSLVITCVKLFDWYYRMKNIKKQYKSTRLHRVCPIRVIA